MSTRANIVLQEKGSALWLYHHCDGYPSYLGWKLMQIMEKHKKDYSDIFDIANEMFKDKEDDGFEITKGQHGDIEYLYLIDIQDKKISCSDAARDFKCSVSLIADAAKGYHGHHRAKGLTWQIL